MNTAKELMEYIVRTLVDDPECFRFHELKDEKGTLFTLSIKRLHAGRILGKKGVTAEAIRSILRTYGGIENHHYALKIEVEDE